MSTTTIRLPEDLKTRVARAAAEAGTTSHAFILDAIVEKAEMAEMRADFHTQADQRFAQFLESGQAVAWEDARAYLKERLAGRNATRPVARKPAR